MTPQLESLCAFFRPHRGVTGLSDWKFFAVAVSSICFIALFLFKGFVYFFRTITFAGGKPSGPMLQRYETKA